MFDDTGHHILTARSSGAMASAVPGGRNPISPATWFIDILDHDQFNSGSDGFSAMSVLREQDWWETARGFLLAGNPHRKSRIDSHECWQSISWSSKPSATWVHHSFRSSHFAQALPGVARKGSGLGQLSPNCTTAVLTDVISHQFQALALRPILLSCFVRRHHSSLARLPISCRRPAQPVWCPETPWLQPAADQVRRPQFGPTCLQESHAHPSRRSHLIDPASPGRSGYPWCNAVPQSERCSEPPTTSRSAAAPWCSVARSISYTADLDLSPSRNASQGSTCQIAQQTSPESAAHFRRWAGLQAKETPARCGCEIRCALSGCAANRPAQNPRQCAIVDRHAQQSLRTEPCRLFLNLGKQVHTHRPADLWCR